MIVMTSALLVLLFAALAAVYLYSRDTDRRNRAWHLLSLLTGRHRAVPAATRRSSGRRASDDLGLRQDFDVPVGSVHADPLAVGDQPGRVQHADHGRQAVLPGDHRAVGHLAADLGHQAGDRDEQG